MTLAKAVFLDIDGTLMDTNYLHIEAWAQAYEGVGARRPRSRIHREVGKGSDPLLPARAERRGGGGGRGGGGAPAALGDPPRGGQGLRQADPRVRRGREGRAGQRAAQRVLRPATGTRAPLARRQRAH